MNTFDSPELTFPAKILEMTANADILINSYTETLATFHALPADFDFPNKQAAIELTELTLKTLVELKVSVKSLYEHSAEVNDKIDDVLRRMKTR